MSAHQNIIKDNIRTTLKIITKHYGCRYSKALYRLLEEHPDFPSFLAFQYVLQRMGKDSFAVKIGYEELLTIPVPCIVHVFTNMDLFLFVSKVTSECVQVEDERGNTEKISREDFLMMWDGNVLLMDEVQGNISFSISDKFDAFISKVRLPFLFCCLALTFVFVLFRKGETHWLFYAYLVGVVAGLVSSAFLVTEQVDKYNLLVKKLCSAKGKNSNVDCSSILDFKDAKFLGVISWSDIGFVYFVTLLVMLLAFPLYVSTTLIGILSTFSLGYVCYSIVYQKFVAKKWCTFCLSVQAVFIFLFVLSVCSLKRFDFHLFSQGYILAGLIIVVLCTLSIYTLYLYGGEVVCCNPNKISHSAKEI